MSNLNIIIVLCISWAIAIPLAILWYRKLSGEMVLHEIENDLSKSQLKKLLSEKKSSEIRLGQIGEHFAPLLDDFPYDSKNVRFLGSPIDFVVFDFENNRVVLLEFKTGNSKQTKKQRQVREIVAAGNVFYEVMRVNEDISIA